MRASHHQLTAVALTASLALAACSDDAESAANTDSATAATTAAETVVGEMLMPAGELRAVLTSHLQEHVYLSGIAVETLHDAGGNLADPAVAGALDALDENSVTIAGLIGAAAPDQEAGFLAMWREHLGFFMDYARAGLAGDAAAQASARSNLDGYRSASGAFFETLTGGALPAAQRTSVSRTLRDLAHRHVIDVRYRHIVVRDVPALRAAAGLVADLR